MRIFRVAPALWAALLLLPTHSSAQDVVPPHIAIVEGEATVSREGERETADTGMPIVPGDVVRTDRGRLQILFPDASVLDLDEFSTFELLSPTLYRLSEGRLLLMMAGAGLGRATGTLTIDTPMASAEMLEPGEYRLSMSGTPSGMQTLFEIVRGSGTLVNDRGATTLRAGEQSVAYGSSPPSYPRTFNSARLDAFTEWSAVLRRERTGGPSTQYLPPDLRTYAGALDQNGSWQYEASYGNVWYPNVAADWQPYDNGYWSSVPAYGWTWVGAGPWAWPTHHYGRWGYQRSRWFWIPGRQWAPAWVSWGTAPGYVSWSPLGFDNRPVFSLAVLGGARWYGWTVVDRTYFGRPRWNVRQYSVGRLPQPTSFVVQQTAPIAPLRRGGGIGRGDAGYSAGRSNASPGNNVPRANRPSGVLDYRRYPEGASERNGSMRPGAVATPRTAPRGASPGMRSPAPAPPAPPRVDRSDRRRRADASATIDRIRPEGSAPAPPPPSPPSDRERTPYARPRAAAPPSSPAQAPPNVRTAPQRERSTGQARATRRADAAPSGGPGGGQTSGSNNGGRAQGRRR